MLACWNPNQLALPDEYSQEYWDACGLTKESEASFAPHWDLREDYQPDVEENGNDRNDCGWVGENEKGVWLKLHPMAALAADELLWDIWTDWRFGARKIKRKDLRRMSNFQVEALTTLMAASARQEIREAKRSRESDDG